MRELHLLLIEEQELQFTTEIELDLLIRVVEQEDLIMLLIIQDTTIALELIELHILQEEVLILIDRVVSVPVPEVAVRLVDLLAQVEVILRLEDHPAQVEVLLHLEDHHLLLQDQVTLTADLHQVVDRLLAADPLVVVQGGAALHAVEEVVDNIKKSILLKGAFLN